MAKLRGRKKKEEALEDNINAIEETVDAVSSDEESSPSSLSKRVEPTSVKPEDFNVVLIDDSVEDDDILKYNKIGALLRFDEEKGFKELPSVVLEQLSKDNLLRYTLAERDHMRWEKAWHPDNLVEGVPVNRRVSAKLSFAGGQALSRINHQGRTEMDDPNNPWHRVWKRPDEVGEAASLGYEKTGNSLNGADGKTELVEFAIEQTRFNAHIQAVEDESRGMTRRVVDEASEAIEEVTGEKAVDTTSHEVKGITE